MRRTHKKGFHPSLKLCLVFTVLACLLTLDARIVPLVRTANQQTSSLGELVIVNTRSLAQTTSKQLAPLKDEGDWQGNTIPESAIDRVPLPINSSFFNPASQDRGRNNQANVLGISSGCIQGALDPGNADCDTSLVEDSITPGAIGSRTPLILIHGIHGREDHFSNLLSHFESISGHFDFKTRYKVYRFEYDSDKFSVWEIARSLRNWLDYKAKLDPNIFKNIVIIAHSMGGLVARSYMNEHDTDYSPVTGGRTGKRGGERVSFLITLSTPHHGTPGANENPRVPNSYATWNTVVGAVDAALWGADGCTACINNPAHVNRSDLRWDNYNNLWAWSDYNNNQERNDWLRSLAHKYDYKIVAYGGYIGGNGDIAELGSGGTLLLLDRMGDRSRNGLEHHEILTAGSVVLQRIFTRNFVSSISEVFNDGAVPIESSLFYGHQVRRIACPGYDHADMKNGKYLLCRNGQTLFRSLELDLSLAQIQPLPTGNLSANPSTGLSFGSVTIGSSSPKSLVLSNTGTSGLNVTSLGISGADAGQFSLENSPTTPFTIAVGQSRTLTVRYTPTSSGSKSASLTINNTSANIPVMTISLSGGGTQASCNYTLSSSSRSFGPSGGSGNFTVQASGGCGWSVQSNANWITVTSSSNSTGTQTVNFTVAVNSSNLFRLGTITIQAGSTTLVFNVSEDGNSTACNYSLSSNNQAFTANGGSGSFLVAIASSGSCGWSANSNAPWITLEPSSTGLKLGTQSISYVITPNSSNSLRFGTISIQGQSTSLVFTVSQDGSINNCTYSLSTTDMNLGQGGGQSSFTINAGAGCLWQVSSPDSWITNISINNGYGSQIINFSAQANQSTNNRYGSIAIRGSNATLNVSVIQAGLPILYPTINLPSTNLSTGDALVNSTIYQSVVINNTGQGYLTLGSIYRSSGSIDFDVLPYGQNQSIAPGGSASVTIKLTPSSVGNRSAIFAVTSNDPSNSTVNFTIAGNGVTQITGGTDFIWTNRFTLPTGVSEAGVATIANSIYVLRGGINNYRYDPTINSWTQLAQSPYPVDVGGAGVINGKIYLVGDVFVNRVQIYDPGTNGWTLGATIPGLLRQWMATAIANGKLYVCGGRLEGGQFSAEVNEYNPVTDTWITKANMPTARYAAVAVTIDNLIYVIGGVGTCCVSNKVEVYNPSSNTWATKTDMPSRRYFSSITDLNNKIYVIGGYEYISGTPSPIVEEYNPATNQWAARNPITFARWLAVAGTVNNKIYVIGGRAPNGGDVLTVEQGELLASPKVNLPSSNAVMGDAAVGVVTEKILEVQNLGNALLTLSYSRLSGGQEFSLFRTPSTLAAGASARIKIRVAPTSIGSKSASFRINTNDPVTPAITFNVTANGVPFQPISTGAWQLTQSLVLPAEALPRSVAIADGKAYVGRSNHSLSVIDVASNTVSADISFTPYPNADTGHVAIAGNKVYVPLSNLGSNGQLAVVNRDTNSVLTYIPIGVDPYATAAGNGRIYVAVRGVLSDPPSIKVVDVNTNTIVGTIPLNGDGLYSVSSIAVEQSLGRAYVSTTCHSCDETGLINVIDLTTNTVINTVAITSYRPRDISIAGNRAYVSTDASVEVIDLSSNTLVASIMLPQFIYSLVATPEYVLAINSGANKMIVISAATNAVAGEVDIFYPLAVGRDPATNYVYVGTGSDMMFKTFRFVSPGFSVSTNAQSLAAIASGSTTFTTTVTSIDGFSGAVNLGCEGLPTGATCQFTQNPVTVLPNNSVSTILTVNVPAGTVSGPYSLRVVGSGSVAQSAVTNSKGSLVTTSVTDFQNLSLTVPSCDFVLSSQSTSIGAGAGTGSVDVSCTTGCSWTAVSNDAWITITSGASGIGNGTVSYSVVANTGVQRTGTITAAGQTYVITQDCPSMAITNQPTNQTVCAGAPVTFSITANSAGSLAYQWRKNAITIPGATSSTYLIASVTTGDTGTYDVVVTGSCGTTISNAAILTVKTVTSIATQPTNQTVCVGASAGLSVLASGTGPFTYQWLKNGNNIAGATNSVYTIAAANTGDAGAYSVVITGGCGTATSNAAALTVNAATGIATQPTNQVVCLGAPASFSVTASGMGPLTYQWRKNGANIAGATSGTFSIASVIAGDAASYDVVVTGTCGTATSTAVPLTVNAATSIATQPVSQTVCPNAPTSFSVTASGTGPFTYQWRKNSSNIAGATNSTFTIATASTADAGNYDVIVNGSCGSATSNPAMLTVNAATAISAQPANQTVCSGTAASFSVTASGTGPFTYQWRKNSTNITGATNSTFSIPSAVNGDAGSYDAIVTGACGSVTANAATLTVNPATTITQQPANQTVTTGQSATFSVTATGVGLTYQWRKNSNNINGATGSSYNIANAIPSDAGNYSVVVTGACGTFTSDTATLTVNCPGISVNPVNPNLPVGRAGIAYSQTFTQTGGIGAMSFSLSAGTLPAGLTLDTSGVLSGTPTVNGTFGFTIRATDTNNCFGERAYTLTLDPPCTTINVNPATLANGFVGTAYSQTLTATGGTAPHTFAVTAGSLPGGLTLAGGGALTGTPTAAGTFTFTVTATDNTGCTGMRSYTVIVSGNGLQFFPLPSPVRLLDTRNFPGVSGCTTAVGAIAANATRTQPARTVCSTIPAQATAIIGNITVIPAGPGYLTLFPSDAAQPTVANSNFKAGEITNNFFTVGLGAGDGAFKIFTSATTEVIIDVTGYYAPPGAANPGGLYYHPLPNPVRLVETRANQPGCFKPAQLVGTNNPNANPALDLQVQGRGPGLPTACNSLPSEAVVLVGNATTVFPNAPFGSGYLTIYPSDATRPTVASSNYASNDIINGPFAVKLGADGRFKVYTFATTDLVIDITGYYSTSANDANGAGLLFTPLPKPMRLLETRDFAGLTGCYTPRAAIPGGPGGIRTQAAWGPCADQAPLTIPMTARALVGNATVINPVGAGFGTFFPGDLGVAPTVATTNFPFPVVFGYNRHYYVGLSPVDGTFKLLTQFTSDYIVDVSGYFAP